MPVAIDGEIFQDAYLVPLKPESEIYLIPKIGGGNRARREALRDKALAWPGQILATIGVCLDDTVRPAELLTAHVCWVNSLPRINSSFFPTDDIEHLVTHAWLRMADRPFFLRMPSITVPELQRACASNAEGWRKIGEVLLAGEHAIPGTVPETMRQTIRKLVA